MKNKKTFYAITFPINSLIPYGNVNGTKFFSTRKGAERCLEKYVEDVESINNRYRKRPKLQTEFEIVEFSIWLFLQSPLYWTYEK